MVICEMQHSDVLSVSSLSDNTFGKDFLTTDFIHFTLESNNYRSFCLKKDNKLIGFAIWEVAATSEISNLFYSEKHFLNNFFNSSNAIAKLNQIAINEEYRNKGYGDYLLNESIKSIPYDVDFLTSIYWVKDGSEAMKKLLIKNGFESIKTITHYWYNDSIEKKYNCAICGAPPCKCSAEIFAKKKPQ